MSTEIAQNLSSLAEQINAEHEAANGAFGSAFEHGARVGILLKQAKMSVPHGEWLPWIRDNCPMSRRTVQMYMRISNEYPRLSSTDTKCATVAHLTLKEADRLLAKPKSKTSSSTPKVVEPTEVLPPPKQARNTGRGVAASDGKIYLGANEEEEAVIGDEDTKTLKQLRRAWARAGNKVRRKFWDEIADWS